MRNIFLLLLHLSRLLFKCLNSPTYDNISSIYNVIKKMNVLTINENKEYEYSLAWYSLL
jgi:hypothetical protein